jgi:hypothetical protein
VTFGRLGLAMAALAGYSAGAALVARGRAAPRLADLLLAYAGAVAAAVLAPRLGWGGGVAAAIGGAMALGAAASAVHPHSLAAAVDTADEPGSAWKRFARRMGNFQARLLLAAMYAIVVAPFAAAGRFTANPLAAPDPASSRWRDRAHAEPSLDHARRQS